MAKAKKKGAKKVWKVVGIVAAVMIGIGAIGAIFSADANKAKTLNAFDYEISAVDAEGKVYESDVSITTKDVVSVNELKIEYTKDANVEYRVHLYDEDEKYLSSTDWLQEDYEYAAEEGSKAVYAHIQIRPIEDEDGRVDVFELSGYANDIKVSYNSEIVDTDATEEGKDSSAE